MKQWKFLRQIWTIFEQPVGFCWIFVLDSFPFVKESEEEDASESDDDEDAHLPQTTRQSGMN